MRLSEDKKEIFVGTNDSELLVYRDNGAAFVLNQTINVGFRPTFISHIPNKLQANGFGPNISFFQYYGGMYTLTQNITTSSSFIGEVMGNEDFSRFVFGGYNKKIGVYEDRNGVYELIEEVDVGKLIYSVSADPDWLYFIVTTLSPTSI